MSIKGVSCGILLTEAGYMAIHVEDWKPVKQRPILLPRPTSGCHLIEEKIPHLGIKYVKQKKLH